MGFLLNAIGVGLAVKGIKTIKHNIEEEKRRKNTVCHFNGDISKEEFYVMVKRGGKGVRRITSLYAEGTMVYGTVRSQSGISDWCFRIDFNDYGNLTGSYWISTDNNDSEIPKIVAGRISQQICDYIEIDRVPGVFCSGHVEGEHVIYDAALRKEAKLHRFDNPASCPYSAIYVCGKEIYSCERTHEPQMLKYWNETE